MTVDLTQLNEDELNASSDKSSGAMIDLTGCGDKNFELKEKSIDYYNAVDQFKEMIDLSQTSHDSPEILTINSTTNPNDNYYQVSSTSSRENNYVYYTEEDQNSDATVEYNFEDSIIQFIHESHESVTSNNSDESNSIVISDDDENINNYSQEEINANYFQQNNDNIEQYNSEVIEHNEIMKTPENEHAIYKNTSSDSKKLASLVVLSPTNKSVSSTVSSPSNSSKRSINLSKQSVKEYDDLTVPFEYFNHNKNNFSPSSVTNTISSSLESHHSEENINKIKSSNNLIYIEDDEFDKMINDIKHKYKSDDSSDKVELFCPLNEYIPPSDQPSIISPITKETTTPQKIISPKSKTKGTTELSPLSPAHRSPLNTLLENNRCSPAASTSQICKTPSQQKSPFTDNLIIYNGNEYIYKTRAVSPKPNYSAMDYDILQENLVKYGIKKDNSRESAIKILEYIYSQTHPIVDNPNTPAANIAALSTPTSKKSKSSKISTTQVSPTSSSTESPPVSPRQNQKLDLEKLKGRFTKIQFETVDSNILAADNFVAEMINEKYILPKKPRKNISLCPVPLHLAFNNLFKANKNFRKAVLTYMPFELDTLLQYFTHIDLRFEKNVSTLSNKCIFKI